MAETPIGVPLRPPGRGRYGNQSQLPRSLQAVSSRAVEKRILLSARSKSPLVPVPQLSLLSSFSASTPNLRLPPSSPKLPPLTLPSAARNTFVAGECTIGGGVGRLG